MTLWSACSEGCPDPYDCPDQPPKSERCPENRGAAGDGYSQCKIIGPHDRHRDGHGMTWWPIDEDDARDV